MSRSHVANQDSYPKPAARSEDYIDLEHLWTIARRNMKLVALCVVLALIAGLLYLRAAPPEFSAQTRILVDDNLGQVTGDLSSVPASMQLDSRISSQIEVLRSMRLAYAVVDAENLTQSQSFLNPPSSPMAQITAPIKKVVALLRGPQEPQTDPTQVASTDPSVAIKGSRAAADNLNERIGDDPNRTRAAIMLQQGLSVERVQRSAVIGVSFDSHDPRLAYRIAQAYADAFVKEQLLANTTASNQATSWMQTRLMELGQEQRRASLAVEDFRAKNGLSQARGELVSEQRLSELTGQLATAQGEVAQAKARADQIAAVVAAGEEDAARRATFAGGDIDDGIVQQLRTRYVDMTRRIDQITANFGEDHPQAVQLRAQRDAVSAQLFGELKQLATRYQNEYQVARSRLEGLEGTLKDQTGSNSGDKLVKLRELEQEAQTLTEIYSSFLTRYEQTVQRESFPVSNMRVISAATQPDRASGPRFTRTMALFTALGLMMGTGFGALREFNERSFRTGGEVSRSGLRFLGYLGELPGTVRRRRFTKGKKEAGPAPLSTDSGIDSAFAETLRNAIHAFPKPRQGSRGRAIGVISVLPGEGKTTVAAHLARLLHRTGYRTLLIDADFRRPALSRSLGKPVEQGLADAIRGTDWRDLIRTDKSSGLPILPTISNEDAAIASVLLSSDAMARMLAELRQEFDFIIVDLPPVGPVIDAKAFEPLIDGFMMVIRWGVTPRALLRSTLSEEPAVARKIVGAVLSATDIEALKRYGNRDSREYAYTAYTAYYNTTQQQ